MIWHNTNIKHPARLAMGLTLSEYVVFDIFYWSKTSEKYSVDGWAKNSYKDICEAIGLTKGAIHKIVDKGVKMGFLEVNEIDPRMKKTTPKWDKNAYVDDDQVVQKVNDFNTSKKPSRSKSERQSVKIVQKVNGNRSKSERHTDIKKNESNKNKRGGEEKQVFEKITGLKKQIGTKQYEALNSIAQKEEIYIRLKALYPSGKFHLLCEWLEYKKEIKKTVVGRGIKNLLGQFEKFTPTEIEDAIKIATSSGWSSIHPKENKKERGLTKDKIDGNLSKLFQPKTAV